jgi:radical SAM protein with 4Fe4S-binding SPASM domain
MKVLDSMADLARAQTVPLYATIELLPGCNLRCLHCYVTPTKRSSLTREVLFDLFDQLADCGTFVVTLTGGEIGLRDDLFEILERATKRRFAVVLLSSGTLWNTGEWDRIAALGVSEVRLSIYAGQARLHDSITRTPGSFARTMATARGLRQRATPVALSMSVLRENADEVEAVSDLAEELDAPFTVDPLVTWTDQDSADPASHRASAEQVERAYRAFFSRAAPPRAELLDWNKARPCTVAESSVFVTSSGDVLPCVTWPEAAGNVISERFADIWRDSPVMRAARGLRMDDLEQCRDCGVRAFCRPCPGMNLRENRTMTRPSRFACNCGAAVARAAVGTSGA